jgi:hypothetical protein
MKYEHNNILIDFDLTDKGRLFLRVMKLIYNVGEESVNSRVTFVGYGFNASILELIYVVICKIFPFSTK